MSGLKGNSWRESAVVILLLSLFLAVFFWKAVFAGEILLPADIINSPKSLPWGNWTSNQSLPHNLTISDAILAYPLWKFAKESIGRGEIPLWNPYIFAGTPFLADSSTGALYPLNIILYLLPLEKAINITQLLHLLLVGIFTYLFLREIGVGRFGAFVGGLVYTFNGAFITYLELLNIWTEAWLPLVFLLVERMVKRNSFGYALLLGVVFAVQWLAGSGQRASYIVFAATLYLLFRLAISYRKGMTATGTARLGGLYALAVALGLLLSAVQLLPTYEFLMDSHRLVARTAASYEDVAFLWLPQLLAFLIPDLFGNPVDYNYFAPGTYTASNGYLGILPLVLAALSLVLVKKNSYVLFFCAFVVLMLSFILGTPLYAVFHSLVPLAKLMPAPIRMLFMYTFAVAVLAAFGADLLAQRSRELGRRALLLVVGSSLAAIVVGITAMLALWTARPWIAQVSAAVIPELVASKQYSLATDANTVKTVEAMVSYELANIGRFILLVGLSVLVVMTARYRPAPVRLAQGLMIGLIVADLFSFGMRYNTTVQASDIYPETGAISFLKKEAAGEQFRFMGVGETRWSLPDMPVKLPVKTMPANSAMFYGIQDAQGYSSFYPLRYNEYANTIAVGGRTPTVIGNKLYLGIYNSKLVDLLNVKYVMTPGYLPEKDKFKLVYEGEIEVFENREVVPRAFTVHRAKVITDKDAILAELLSDRFEPLSYAVLEEPPGGPLPGLPSAGSPRRTGGKAAEIVSYQSNQVVVRADIAEAGLLVLADTYYPGWKAFVDGREARIQRANYLFRAVYLEAGSHTVEFVFDPGSFKLGLAISIGTLALVTCLAYVLRKGPKPRRF